MKKLIIISAIIVIFTAVVAIYYFIEKPSSSGQNPPISPAPTSTVSAVPAEASSTLGMKLYKNTDFGFEFQYPEDLIIKENSYGGYYSKFNLEMVIKSGEYLDSVFLVNIVIPEFADRTFLGVEAATSPVTVAGVTGIRYDYVFEDLPETAIVLPFGQYKIILARLGTIKRNEYDEYVNQILASFKFLK